MLAHRARTGLSIALAAAATGALALLTPSAPPAEVALVIPEVVAPVPQAPVENPCPPGARELVHVDAAATLTCLHGNFDGPSWFVRAVYTTTEPWERLGVISDDGRRVLVGFEDGPIMANHDAGSMQLDGDNAVTITYPTHGGARHSFVVHVFVRRELPAFASFAYSPEPPPPPIDIDYEH